MTQKTRIQFKWHHINISMLDGIFSRGDRRLNHTLELAYKKGCRFDGWSDCQHFPLWEQSFAESNVDPNAYWGSIPLDATLPWDHLSVKVAKKFLKKEWDKALAMDTTPLTGFDNCVYCGSCKASDLVHLKDQHDEARQSKPSEISTEQNDLEREKNFRYRASFKKEGALRFISHLDITKTLRLAFKRADIPLSYSKGFHPSPHISFGPALPLAVESKEEFIDFYTYRYFSPDESLARLNKAMPPELQFLHIVEIPHNTPSLSALIDGSDYSVNFSEAAIEPIVRNFATKKGIDIEVSHKFAIDAFLEKPEVLIKKHKTEKFVDAKKFVRSIRWDDESRKLNIEMKFQDGATVGIQHVLKALYEIDVEFPVTRERQYIWNNGTKESPLFTGERERPRPH
jgi:radical SAM-linked protein